MMFLVLNSLCNGDVPLFTCVHGFTVLCRQAWEDDSEMKMASSEISPLKQ